MTPPTAPTALATSHASSGVGEPELGEVQRHALDVLREAPEVQNVELVSVTLVTASVQAVIEITAHGQRPYRALIAPSGRIHRV